MWPDRRLQDLFKIDHPIIQAPMGGAVDLKIASAVSRAGGLGSLACAAATPEALGRVLRRAQERVGLSINVNFFAHHSPPPDAQRDSTWLSHLDSYYKELHTDLPSSLDPGSLVPFDDERCGVIEETTPSVVSFHFGLPEERLVDRVKAAGARVLCSATTVEEALWLESKGCDAIIAQGLEAGGHRGMFLSKDMGEQIGTFALVPQIADAVAVPVIAAGGIADGRGIAAALALGAAGVQVGTAYLFTQEATIDPHYRRTLSSISAKDTVVSNVISGRPTRIARTRMTDELGPMNQAAPDFPRGFGAIAPLKKEAEAKDLTDFSAHYCGQAAPLGHASTAEELTSRLVTETQTAIESLSRRE